MTGNISLHGTLVSICLNIYMLANDRLSVSGFSSYLKWSLHHLPHPLPVSLHTQFQETIISHLYKYSFIKHLVSFAVRGYRRGGWWYFPGFISLASVLAIYFLVCGTVLSFIVMDIPEQLNKYVYPSFGVSWISKDQQQGRIIGVAGYSNSGIPHTYLQMVSNEPLLVVLINPYLSFSQAGTLK